MSGSPASWGAGKTAATAATFNNNTSNVINEPSNQSSILHYISEDFSWAIWLKKNYSALTAAQMWAFTVGRADAGGRGYGLKVDSSSAVKVFFGSSSWSVSSVPDNEWHHIVFTRTGTAIKIYRDGTLVTNATFSGTLPTYSDGYGVGVGCFHYSGNIYPLIGSIQDFRIYDHCLSAKEVRELSKGLMIHLPFNGCGYQGIGTNIANGATVAASAWKSPKTVNVGQYYTALGINSTSYFGLRSGDTYMYRVKLTAPSTKGISARVQYYTDSSTRTGPTGNAVAAGTTGYSTVTATLNDSTRGYNQMQLLITNANTSVTSSDPVIVEEVKLERGSTATGWSPALNSADYTDDYSLGETTPGMHGVVQSADPPDAMVDPTARNGMCAAFKSGSYITYTTPTGMSQATLAFWLWIPSNQTAYPALDISSGSPSGNLWLSCNTEQHGLWAYWSGAYHRAGENVYLSANTWYHVAFTFNAGTTQWYLNGEAFGSSSTAMSAKSTTFPSGTRTIGDSYTGTNWNGAAFNGRMADWRLYSTVLSAADIKRLYNSPISLANNGTMFATQFDDTGSKASAKKNGVFLSTDMDEVAPHVDRVEPDGSKWMRIVHHADPTTYKFASSDPFAIWVAKDERRYFIGEACDRVNRWELMIEQKPTAASSVEKYRWVQTKNPNLASFSDVAAASVTKNTSSGYSTHSSYGGIHKFSNPAMTYWCANNGTSGNWFGALGACSSWSTGIPGYAGKAIADGGYIDLYIRIDGGAVWKNQFSIYNSSKAISGFGFDETA